MKIDNFHRSLVPFLIFCGTLSIVETGRVLYLVPFNGPSHWIYASHFIRELLNRGHHVTAITGITWNGPKHTNYSEVLIDPPFDFNVVAKDEDVFKTKSASSFSFSKWVYYVGLVNSEHGLKSKNVQQFIESDDDHYDLVISEQMNQETWLLFAHKFNAPIITVSTMGYAQYMDYANGLVTPLAYVPNIMLNYDDRMTFRERMENVLVTLYDWYLRLTYYMPENNRLADTYFAALKKRGPLPSVEEMERSMALMLANTHHAFSRPRPLMPNMINIGGAHLRPRPAKLPSDIQMFIDEASDGVIYMSLGAFVKSSLMPKDKVEAILGAFSRLKQRVLWKWEDEKMPNLPPNVMVRKWMPQSDILAHENVKVFIGHGGIAGTYEGIYYAKPMLFIPFYGDQHRNSLRCEKAGFALRVKFEEITEELLFTKLTELLKNSTYVTQANQVSEVFRDNPMHPMETAMYFIEYVMRHKGAPYLKSAAIELKWYQTLLLDVMAFLLTLLVMLVICVWIVVKVVWMTFKGEKAYESISSKKRRNKREKAY